MAITVVEHTATPVTGASPSTLSTTKTLTAGSTIIVFGEGSSGGAALTISDGVNTYAQKQTVTDATTIKTWCWIAENVAGGSTTITVSGYGGFGGSLLLYELQGASTSVSYDASDSIANANSTTPIYAAQAGGITVSAGALAFALFRYDRDPSGLTASGYTAGTDSNRSGIAYFFPRWKTFAGGASGERASSTLGSASGYSTGVLISVKAAAGGGASGIRKLLLGVN